VILSTSANKGVGGEGIVWYETVLAVSCCLVLWVITRL